MKKIDPIKEVRHLDQVRGDYNINLHLPYGDEICPIRCVRIGRVNEKIAHHIVDMHNKYLMDQPIPKLQINT